MEDLALDRAALHHDADVAVERVDPRLQECVDRRRDDDLAVASVLAHHREHLLDVERVARRRGRDPLAEPAVERSVAHETLRSARRTRLAPSGSSRSAVAFSFPPPQSGRTSRSSVRATQRRKIGASRERSATCSTRSMKTGSAHCRSSITTTCGRSVARASRRRRNASCVSAGDVPITESGLDADRRRGSRRAASR